jgi:hypothetical protein
MSPGSDLRPLLDYFHSFIALGLTYKPGTPIKIVLPLILTCSCLMIIFLSVPNNLFKLHTSKTDQLFSLPKSTTAKMMHLCLPRIPGQKYPVIYTCLLFFSYTVSFTIVLQKNTVYKHMSHIIL